MVIASMISRSSSISVSVVPTLVISATTPMAPQQVEDVAAQDIADGDQRLAPPCRRGAYGELWQRRTDGDDGQADDRLGHAEFMGDTDGAHHQPVGTHDQQDQTDNGEYDGMAERHRFGFDLGILSQFGPVGASGAPVAMKDVEAQQGDHDQAVPEREIANQAGGDEGRRHHQHQPHVMVDLRALDNNRIDRSADADDQKNIRNIAADRIAHGELGVAQDGRFNTDQDLRRRRTESDQNHRHDQL